MNSVTDNRQEKNKGGLMIVVPRLCMGGQERVAVKTAEVMKDSYMPTMVIFDDRNAFFSPQCQLINIDVHASWNVLSKIINAFKRLRKINAVKKQYQPEFCLSFGNTANYINAMSPGCGKILVSVRAYANISTNLLSRFTYLKADRIICCSRVLQLEMNRLFPECASRTRYLANPCDIDKIRCLGMEPVTDYEFGTHTVISHGRLDAIKDYTRLIRAFSVVKKTVNDAKLLILGDGNQTGQLKRLIDELNMTDSVTLLGAKENPFAYIEKSAVYVLSSVSEGFPNALIEGMAFLPVIATDCKSGPREILSDGQLDKVAEQIEEAEYGVLIKPAEISFDTPDITADDEMLAKAVIMLLTDEEKARMYKEAALKRTNVYSVDSYKRKLQEILDDTADT